MPEYPETPPFPGIDLPFKCSLRPFFGVQYRFDIGNRLAMSAIKGELSYGGPQVMWEVAILGKRGKILPLGGIAADLDKYEAPEGAQVSNLHGLSEDTPVVGYLTEHEVAFFIETVCARLGK